MNIAKNKKVLIGLAIAGIAAVMYMNSAAYLRSRLASLQAQLNAERADGVQKVNGVTEVARRRAIIAEIAAIKGRLATA